MIIRPTKTVAGRNATLDTSNRGVELVLKYAAIGDSGGAISDTLTALRHEKIRVPLYGSKVSANQLHLDALFPESADSFWVREVGIFDDAGVLIYYWSTTGTELGHKSATLEFLLGMELYVDDDIEGHVTVQSAGNLFTTPATTEARGVVELATSEEVRAGTDATKAVTAKNLGDVGISALIQDMDGIHTAGASYNLGLPIQIEAGFLTDSVRAEAEADRLRMLGQSGVMGVRHLTAHGDASFHRPFDDAFAPLNNHDHPDFRGTMGQGECVYLVNGYYIRSRHNDYLTASTADKTRPYLATDYINPPAAPASVSSKPTVAEQVDEMREYYRAFYMRDTTIRDYRPHFRLNLSYVEMWFEKITGDAIADTFESLRHQINTNSMRGLIAKVLKFSMGGHKDLLENVSFVNNIVRYVGADGVPYYAALRYRIVCKDIGTVGTYPIESLLSPRDIARSRVRRERSVIGDFLSNSQRYRVRNALNDDDIKNRPDVYPLLDQIMNTVPGLDGLNNTLTEKYLNGQTELTLGYINDGSDLKAGYYNRFYDYPFNDAVGRKNAMRSFNDPNLFVAKTTRPEVMSVNIEGFDYAFSYAIPLEIIVRAPHEGWNPYGIAYNEANPAGDGSQTNPYTTYRNSTYFITNPAELYGVNSASDVASTGTNKWMKGADGQAHLCTPSGLRQMVNLGFGAIKMRYPIYEVYQEGSLEYAEMEAQAVEMSQSVMYLQNKVFKQEEKLDDVQSKLSIIENIVLNKRN